MNTRPRKRFGQHFLRDVGVIQNIVDHARISAQEVLCEIGPGRGALSDELAKKENALHLIEIDRDLVPLLRERYKDNAQITVHEQDALMLDLAALNAPTPLVLLGNLPYNISTALMIHLSSQRGRIERMLFMVQKEVAERLTAAPGGKDYGRLSVMMARLFEMDLAFHVGPEAFNPPPKVWSSVVAFMPRSTPLGDPVNDESFEYLVRQAFSQRRKTLRNTLKGLCSEELIVEAGIDPGVRPERVTVEEYTRLVSLTGRSGYGK